MKQEVLNQFDLPWLPMSALIIFVICFACYAFWTYKKENKQHFDEASLLPLADENHKHFVMEGNHERR